MKPVWEVKPENLLGRKVMGVDLEPVRNIIKNKNILITGAAGSIGSEIARQIAFLNPKVIVCLDWSENGLFDLQLELPKKFPNVNFVFFIANIQDKVRINKCFQQYKPGIVYAAAAYKHVPLMEENPTEAIKNNVLATFDLAELAIKHEVKKLIFISTDKALKPANVMGASKRLAENIIKYFNKKKKTKFISVRFCNVLGSRGSVVPVFSKQIVEGGPVTITDKRAIRYFMTVSEAVQLTLQASILGQGGETFVLDGGSPIKIYDLAKKLIRLYQPTKKIMFDIVGLRPGERLSEENLINGEKVSPTNSRGIFIDESKDMEIDGLLKSLDRFREIVLKGEEDRLIFKELAKIFKSFEQKDKRK